MYFCFIAQTGALVRIGRRQSMPSKYIDNLRAAQ